MAVLTQEEIKKIIPHRVTLSLQGNKGKLGFFGGVKEAKFRRQVKPGDALRIEVEIVKVKGPVGVGKGVCTVDGEKAVSAEIFFAIK